jgi:hypothetical protein
MRAREDGSTKISIFFGGLQNDAIRGEMTSDRGRHAAPFTMNAGE